MRDLPAIPLSNVSTIARVFQKILLKIATIELRLLQPAIGRVTDADRLGKGANTVAVE
jgi:hypothetical protein